MTEEQKKEIREELDALTDEIQSVMSSAIESVEIADNLAKTVALLVSERTITLSTFENAYERAQDIDKNAVELIEEIESTWKN